MNRILYFSNDYCTHDYRFLSSLAENGNQVFHVRLEAVRRQVEDRPVPAGVEIVHWAGGRDAFRWRDLPGLVRDFRRLARAIQPDLVHAGPLQTCAFIAILSGYHPVLAMSWGFDLMEDAERNRWWRWATRFVLQRADFFISDARVTRDRAVAYGMDAARTDVFPWGVDLEQFSPSGAGRLAPGGFTLLCNRSWEPRYGVDLLARAFVQAARADAELRLILLGGGSQAQVIRQVLERGGVSERVTFAGQIPQKDLPRYYRMADLYISPSHVDGSSVSLLEAMACGLPALVSDIPANCEWVTDGVNGRVFPDGALDALAAGILRAKENPAESRAFGLAAREVAESRADWKVNFQHLLGAYQMTLDNRRLVSKNE